MDVTFRQNEVNSDNFLCDEDQCNTEMRTNDGDSIHRDKDLKNYLRQIEKIKEEYLTERDQTAKLLLQACVNMKLINSYTTGQRKSSKRYRKKCVTKS